MSTLDRRYLLRRSYYRRVRAAFLVAVGIHVAFFIMAPPYQPVPRIMRADPLRLVAAGAGPGSIAIMPVANGGAVRATDSRTATFDGVMQAPEETSDIRSEQMGGATGGSPSQTPTNAAESGIPAGGGDEPPTYYAYDTPPKALKTFEPVYPSMAKAAGAEGTIVINVNLDERGRILRAWVASANAPELLITAALDAAYRFEFAPGLFRGVAVKSTVAIPFRFYLNKIS